jgi:mannose-6-phosphate isomerase-like protein (cupin superfamily)
MSRLAVALCALSLAVPRAAQAQARRTDVEYLAAGALHALADTLAAQHAPGRPLGDRGEFTYLLLRRDTTGVPEVHEQWADVLVVQSGSGVMLHGGRVSGGHPEGHGEWRGGEIVGGTRQRLGPGDVLIIPAGAPHQVVLAGGERLTYLALKIAARPDSTRAP